MGAAHGAGYPKRYPKYPKFHRGAKGDRGSADYQEADAVGHSLTNVAGIAHGR
jgi:hypothetical protein